MLEEEPRVLDFEHDRRRMSRHEAAWICCMHGWVQKITIDNLIPQYSFRQQ